MLWNPALCFVVVLYQLSCGESLQCMISCWGSTLYPGTILEEGGWLKTGKVEKRDILTTFLYWFGLNMVALVFLLLFTDILAMSILVC